MTGAVKRSTVALRDSTIVLSAMRSWSIRSGRAAELRPHACGATAPAVWLSSASSGDYEQPSGRGFSPIGGRYDCLLHGVVVPTSKSIFD